MTISYHWNMLPAYCQRRGLEFRPLRWIAELLLLSSLWRVDAGGYKGRPGKVCGSSVFLAVVRRPIGSAHYLPSIASSLCFLGVGEFSSPAAVLPDLCPGRPQEAW